MSSEMSDWHTHVYTSTYTSDVSGACSVMYELGGLSVLHDPSGCNSTYTTHDEPRWYDSKSLMYVSGIDEMDAVFGDDSRIIQDVVKAVDTLHPRFVMLCGASIPHIIGFDYRGVASLIEKKVGIPVLPVVTDGLQSYVNGVDLASIAFCKRFVKQEEQDSNLVNLLGVTPIDFANASIVKGLQDSVASLEYQVHCTFAFGNTFDQLTTLTKAHTNLVVSSAARRQAKYLQRKFGMHSIEGLPIGKHMRERIQNCLRDDSTSMIAYEQNQTGNVLVIGEEIYANSLATEINDSHTQYKAFALYPDVTYGLDEDALIDAMHQVDIVICDPLFQNVCPPHTKLIPIPHIGYSGRIFQKQIPTFTSLDFDIQEYIEEKKK